MKQWFSQRIGEKEIKNEVQIESMDQELRNRLWNRVREFLINRGTWSRVSGWSGDISKFCDHFWDSYLKNPAHELSGGRQKLEQVLTEIHNIFMEKEWHEPYSIIEFIQYFYGDKQGGQKFAERINRVLKQEMSGYRLVDEEICQITEEKEILEIEEAIDKSENQYQGIKEHLNSALKKLSDRENPDFRNSIKESISAVESMAREMTGDPDATLGQALNQLEDKTDLHPALKDSFSSLYGYTSDEDGLRHAMLEKPNLDFEDAKYMLVSCSAFVNYLIEKQRKIED